ncbi:hypothetical protein RN001_001970 [Aquatica leii]|uniref:Complex 1 LYR protein domain-containing protein n=1 Tax=Aquatica leii TaxID=1421715 RepID=A0AAN7PGI1_9COLE|nr:hypothetical protein RN001_001970 [Aquatica leii]
MHSRQQILSLYKSLMKESNKFSSYNYRNYALRRIRDAFRENMNLTDNNQITKIVKDGYRNLEIIKRQVLIGDLYKSDKLVIENVKLLA